MNLLNKTTLLPKQMEFAISPVKVILLTVACLLGVGVIYSLLHLEMTRYALGQPVELPKAAYARTSCGGTYEVLLITIGPNGEISNKDGMMGIDEMDYLVWEKTKDKPRYHGWFMDSAGDMAREEYIQELKVHLRVDAACPAEKVADVTSILERRGIRHAYFRVNEE